MFSKKIIYKCLKENKTPILVGGTGLYFNAITKGISKIPNIGSGIAINDRIKRASKF